MMHVGKPSIGWRHHRSRLLIEGLEDRRLLALDVLSSGAALTTGPNAEDFETGNFAKFPWQQGGGGWRIDSAEQHAGAHSARAGSTSHGGSSSFEVTVSIPEAGDLSFWRKVSSENYYDYFRFYIDGQLQDQWTGEVDWGPETYTISAGQHTFRWQYDKDLSGSRGADTAWLDDIEFPLADSTAPPTLTQISPSPNAAIDTGRLDVDVTFSHAVVGVDASDLILTGAAAARARVNAPSQLGNNAWRFPVTGIAEGPLGLRLAPDVGDITDATGQPLSARSWSYTASTFHGEDFEFGDLRKFPWVSSGDASWTVSSAERHGGSYSAQVGSIAHNQTSSLEVTLSAPTNGEISFWRKVSSERNYDSLRFSIDGQLKGRWSGELDWAQETYTVSQGSHTYRWEYVKDGSVSRGGDKGWIDDIVFPLVAPSNAPTISRIEPQPNSSVSSGLLDVTVTFSEPVVGVDAGDIELAGAAASAATVGQPIPKANNAWTFPITGLVGGPLNIQLAPDRGDIRSQDGQDVSNIDWSYTVATLHGDDFEWGDFARYPWTRSGNADWSVTTAEQHDGAHGAQSGAIGNGQTSTLQVTLTTTAVGDLSFWRKVSSERNYDHLRFSIDGQLQDRWSGEQDWGRETYTVAPGRHTFSWSYTKDASVSRGADAAWIDDILFPPGNHPLGQDVAPPTVIDTRPAADANISTSFTDVDVTFSEVVNGVDVSDLVLGGPAARSATVGTPTYQGSNTWRFPVSGLSDGTLIMRLAPDASDIEDARGNDLPPQYWTYTVASNNDVEDFETDLVKFPWDTADWHVTNAESHLGSASGRASDVGNNGKSSLEVTLTTHIGIISFWRKVSSETNFDYLSFSINGVEQERWSGEVPWGKESYPVDAGTYTFTWEYSKDGSMSRGADTAWLDDIFFQVNPDITPPSVDVIEPLPASDITWPSWHLDVTFSEIVQGIDASDLVLSGTAAERARALTPIDLGDSKWRFPIAGLSEGDLQVTLAPDRNDIRDRAGNSMTPQVWDFDASIAIGSGIRMVPNYTDPQGEGFFDPVLGPARQQAFEHALGIWQGVLGGGHVGETITVDASMSSMGTGTNVTLASARSRSIHSNYDGMPPDIWYGAPLANHLAGYDVYPLSEIVAEFNSDVDDNSGRDWYYGLDGNPGGDYDFVTAVLHEVGHGLNFFDLLEQDGRWEYDEPGIYDTFLETGDGTRLADMTSSTRAAALVSDDLWWGGQLGTSGNGGVRPQIKAPNPYEPGSSGSHLDELQHTNELMSPTLSRATHTISPIELGMMLDMGWTLAAGSSSNAILQSLTDVVSNSNQTLAANRTVRAPVSLTLDPSDDARAHQSGEPNWHELARSYTPLDSVDSIIGMIPRTNSSVALTDFEFQVRPRAVEAYLDAPTSAFPDDLTLAINAPREALGDLLSDWIDGAWE